MKVEYLNHMGDDLAIINAARVSHDKRSRWESTLVSVFEGENDQIEREYRRHLSNADASLMRYLGRGLTESDWKSLLAEVVMCQTAEAAEALVRRIRNIQQHFAPFCHGIVSMRVTAPLAIARQLWKSHIGLASQDDNLAWSEMSMRYVSPNEIHQPEIWRKRAENVKQGSSDEAVTHVPHPSDEFPRSIFDEFGFVVEHTTDSYKRMLKAGVAPEQARFVLPMATMTTWVWTGSVLAFSRIVKLRLDSHAQRETQEVARQIEAIVEPLFPAAWEALK